MMFLILCIVQLSFILQSCTALGTTTAVICWSECPHQSIPFTTPPHVRLCFTYDETEPCTSTSTFLVDTGSTGMVTRVGALGILPDEPKTPDAHLYLSSSRTLYKGFWVNRWVWFNRGTEHEVRAQVQVLAVEHKCVCPRYAPYSAGPSGAYCGSSGFGACGPKGCPCGARCYLDFFHRPPLVCEPVQPVPPEGDPVSLMGIGFGRTYDGQEQSTPDKNVLLQVTKIGRTSTTGAAVGTTYSPGWIIDKEGITIGLTSTNWDPFRSREVSLPAPMPNPPTPRHTWQWGEIPGTYSVAGFRPSDCYGIHSCGILIDTGISYASARSQEAIPDTVVRDSDPDSFRLGNGQWVSASFGLGRGVVLTEGFSSRSVPDTLNTFEPEYVKVSQVRSKPSGYNTGMHMLRKWRMAIDFSRGVVGFARAESDPGVCLSQVCRVRET